VISSFGHTPAKCRIYKGQNLHAGNDLGKGKDEKNDLAWHGPKDEPNPYRVEWNDLMYAIRNDKPYNEVRRGAEASLVTAMGRMAAHTGQIITRDQMLNCEHELAPDVDKFEMNSPAPVRAGADGKYPVPRPGRNKKREY